MRLTELRDFLIEEILKQEGTSLNGHPEKRLPNNANFRFEDHSGETLVIKLDMEGICASTGSACTTGSTEPSHVLKAMGRSEKESGENVRFSLGRETTKEELETLITTLRKIL